MVTQYITSPRNMWQITLMSMLCVCICVGVGEMVLCCPWFHILPHYFVSAWAIRHKFLFSFRVISFRSPSVSYGSDEAHLNRRRRPSITAQTGKHRRSRHHDAGREPYDAQHCRRRGGHPISGLLHLLWQETTQRSRIPEENPWA